MPNALTLETMSPGLLKGVATRSHEPHRRKSRMREIRSSGSGEGLGWATSQPTLQGTFSPAPLGATPQPRQSASGLCCEQRGSRSERGHRVIASRIFAVLDEIAGTRREAP